MPEPPTTSSPLSHGASLGTIIAKWVEGSKDKAGGPLRKSEIRSSKSETRTNDRNLNVSNGDPGQRQRFGHSNFVLPRACLAVAGLERDAEVVVPIAPGDLFDLGFADVACKAALDVLDAIVDFLRRALDEHLDGAVGQVPYEARHVVASGDVHGRVPEAHALNLTLEDDVLCRLFHRSCPFAVD